MNRDQYLLKCKTDHLLRLLEDARFVSAHIDALSDSNLPINISRDTRILRDVVTNTTSIARSLSMRIRKEL